MQPSGLVANSQLCLFSAVAKANAEKYHIYAEGDSWFAYPRQWIVVGADSNAIQCLGEHDDLIIYNRATVGDEAVTMVSGEQKLEMFKTLNQQKFDVLLFSGGGNDMGAYDFDFLLLDWQPSRFQAPGDFDPRKCLQMDRVNRRLRRIEDAYLELVDLTVQFSKNTGIKIVTHNYGLAVPSPIGASFFDGAFHYDHGHSWMYPYLKAKGYYSDDTGKLMAREIVAYLMTQFAQILQNVQDAHPGKFFVAETQKVLNDNDWLNEIHPTPAGFKKVADVIYQKIVQTVP